MKTRAINFKARTRLDSNINKNFVGFLGKSEFLPFQRLPSLDCRFLKFHDYECSDSS